MYKVIIFILFLFLFAFSSSPDATGERIICDTVPSGVPQLFGGKYYQFKGYVLADSFLMTKAGDTNNIPYFPSLEFKSSDNRWYGHDRTKWQRLIWFGDTINLIATKSDINKSFDTVDLQDVTDNGNKTTNAIFTRKQLYTPKLGSDSLAESNFEFIIMPDLQGMTKFFPFKLKSMFQWVVDNRVSENIQSVFTVGDLSETATASEFLLLDTVFDYLDPFDIKYLPVIGNHDYDGDDFFGGFRPPATEFNTQLGPSRLSPKPWYGSSFQNSHENYFIKFDVGSYKFLAVALETFPRDSAIAWADSVIRVYPDRKVIVSTHAYITAWGERAADTAGHSINFYGVTGNAGQALWDKLLKKHENISLVLNGHFVNGTVSQNRWVQRLTDKGDSGNVVHQIFINYQQDSVGGSILDNGQGWLMKMRIQPATGRAFTSIYSPYLNQYDSRVDSFDLFLPSTIVKTDMGVEGHLVVRKEIHTGEGLFLDEDMPKYSIPTVQDNKKLVGIANLKYQSNLLTVPNVLVNDLIASKVVFTGTGGRLMTADRFRYITATNRLGVNMSIFDPVTTLDVRGSIGVNYTNSFNYPLFFKDGFSPALNVHHASGNWGATISRSDASTTGSANLVFYHSFTTDPHVKTPPPLGAALGRISFQAPRNDTVNVVEYANIYVRAADTSTASPKGEFIFQIGNNLLTTDEQKFGIFSSGNVSISRSVADAGLKLWVNGSIGAHKDSATLLSALTTQHITAWDTVDHKFKRIRASDLGLNTTFEQSIINGNTLTANRTIVNGTNQLDITGSRSFGSGYTFGVTNSGSVGVAIKGITTDGRGVWADATTGFGLYGSATTGSGVFATTTSGNAIISQSLSDGLSMESIVNHSSTNTVVPIISLTRTTGTAANGIGQSLQFYTENASGINDSSAFIEVSYTDAAAATANSKLVFKLSNNALLAEKMTIAGNGQITEHGYGAAAFTGTPATRPIYTTTGLKIEEIHPKMYTVLLTQSGTNAPTATVLGTNTIGAIVWTRNSAGNYTGTLSGAFTLDKTWIDINDSDEASTAILYKLKRADANTVTLITRDATVSNVDNFTNLSIEIRVYP